MIWENIQMKSKMNSANEE